MQNKPIGVFDSGYGGLTVLKELVAQLPQYDILYLGDNARAPYGPRAFETIYQYTLEAVKWFFKMNCPLVILACNTASAKALRTIQQKDLPLIDESKRVLGVIRPTAEVISTFTTTNNVGILGTKGTIASNSYPLEIEKFYPQIKVHQQACPMWVPLVENNELDSEGTNFFIKKYLNELFLKSSEIDSILLACTHYPLLKKKIELLAPKPVTVISQGEIVAKSLEDYLKRHNEIDERISKNGRVCFYTTDAIDDFNSKAGIFYGTQVEATRIQL